MNGHLEKRTTVGALTHTERVWHELLTYQEPNAWASCQKAAILAGSLLLLHWEQSGRFSRLMEKSSAEAWQFPDRLFGGLYGVDMRGAIGRIIKTLYLQHRDLVKAAIDYARLVRDALLYWGTAKGKGYEGKKSDDPYVVSTETRADQLLLPFFPWVDVANLGLAQNICTWDCFQRDLAMFADAYDIFWREKAVIMGSDMLPRRLSDSECTWDHVTEILCKFKTAAQLKKKLKQFKTLQEQFSSSSKVPASTPPRTIDGTSAVLGGKGGAASVVSIGGEDVPFEEDEGGEQEASSNASSASTKERRLRSSGASCSKVTVSVAVGYGDAVGVAQDLTGKKRKPSPGSDSPSTSRHGCTPTQHRGKKLRKQQKSKWT